MNKRKLRLEQDARINEEIKYGVTLLDIRKNRSDNRMFLCLVRGVLLFLAVYGTIVGLIASFELPFNKPLVFFTLLALSILSAFIYYNKVTFYTGYVIVFLLLIVMAFALYMYINSGFQAFLNEVISRYETFFRIVSGRVAEEQIEDRYVSVSVMLIFVGAVFSIFFNITISGYMDLPMTFIVSFLPLQFAFYIDIVPPKMYLVMLLGVYISVAVLGRSGRYTLPYKYQKDKPFACVRYNHSTSHYYQASGMGMSVMLIYSLLLATVVMLVAGGVFNTDFSTKHISNSVKDTTDKYVKTVVVSGISSLFNRYDAVGGLSKGQLGGIRSVNPDYQTDLIAEYTPINAEPIYLKAYTGVRYERNHFYNTLIDNSTYKSYDDIIVADDYIPIAGADITYNKIHIENVDADASYDYQPYVPLYTTDAATPSKTGIAPKRSEYIKKLLPILDITPDMTLSDNTYETIYAPLHANANYGANDLDKMYEYEDIYCEYPAYLSDTLSSICDEARLNLDDTEDLDTLDESARRLIIASRLMNFFESNFTYTYSPGATPYDSDVVEHFLETSRRGFCAHFASASTLILRYMGIPARYCEGYLLEPTSTLNNEQLSDNLYRIELSDANAHAWTEIYIAGYGWIPYEMTPPAAEDEVPSGNLGVLGIFAGLFNPTERLVDDSDGPLNSIVLGDAIDNAAESAAGGAASSVSGAGLSKFIDSVGYLLLPFIWMAITLAIVIILYYMIRRLALELRRIRLIKRGSYGDALLLEYRYILRQLKKRKIINIKNPSVRDVQAILSDLIDAANYNKRIPITKEELCSLMDVVYISAFAPDEIGIDTYNKSRRTLLRLRHLRTHR